MAVKPRQIVAMGGGGFSTEPDNPALDRFVLSLAATGDPAICFLPTASGDAAGYIERFYAAFSALPARPTHFSLFDPPATDFRGLFLAQDVIYVGGGNTRNLLTLWREWGLDVILREAWEAGVVLAGISAGSLCWFAEGVTDSIPGQYTPLRCLGFLPGSNNVHYDSEPGRRPAYHRLIGGGVIGGGIAAEDGVALHFVGDHLEQVVSSRPGATAYRVERRGAVVAETPRPARLLPAEPVGAGREDG